MQEELVGVQVEIFAEVPTVEACVVVVVVVALV